MDRNSWTADLCKILDVSYVSMNAIYWEIYLTITNTQTRPYRRVVQSAITATYRVNDHRHHWLGEWPATLLAPSRMLWHVYRDDNLKNSNPCSWWMLFGNSICYEWSRTRFPFWYVKLALKWSPSLVDLFLTRWLWWVVKLNRSIKPVKRWNTRMHRSSRRFIHLHDIYDCIKFMYMASCYG